MEKEKSNIYISLMEATKLCNYSQEYLSLRARRGKLKSVKQGRNWVTTKEWIDEYVKKTEGYKDEMAKKNRDKEIFFKIKTAPFSFDKKVFEKPISVFASQEKKYFPTINLYESAANIDNSSPPDNLPIENIRFSKINRYDSLLSLLKVGFSLGLVFGVITGALIFNRIYFGNLLNSGYAVVSDFFYGTSYAVGTFKEYFSWLGETSVNSGTKFYGLANGLGAIIKYLF